MNSTYQDTMLDSYFNAYQPRLDSWNRLKSSAAKLAVPNLANTTLKKHTEVVETLLKKLALTEKYWGFPGSETFNQLEESYRTGNYNLFSREISLIVRMLMSGSYRRSESYNEVDLSFDDPDNLDDRNFSTQHRPYFEVMVVDEIGTKAQESEQKEAFIQCRRNQDDFVYEPVFIHSAEDAVMAILFNFNIQSVVIRYDFPIASPNGTQVLDHPLLQDLHIDFHQLESDEIGVALAKAIKHVRPEMDVFLITDQSVEAIAGKITGYCRRVFYNTEDFLELHLNILRGIQARYQTPFFSALKEYSKKPTGVFHAMPISRGKSIIKSHWIKDMGEFYGINTFLAETSATSGGLDSLLEPTGPIKEAQELASRAFGSERTFFATNGTSTCNKIVVQALVQPNDIVLVDRDCHKSHHYGLVLSGAEVVYLDSYPLNQYSMYGAVPLREIKHQLLLLKAANKLHRVKMLLLTNCTFDGVVYHVEKYMRECLAIKPDLIFLWDEAWFGFARFTPTYRKRTGMHAAKNLKKQLQTDEYAKCYAEHREQLADTEDINTLVETPLLPNPDEVKIRVYTTQSTHKTLTSLRQGSMIHIHDEQYQAKVQEAFKAAYMTHTSTSPNYQILASLDIGRRQTELEGFELVSKQVEIAMMFRYQVNASPMLNKYFKILSPNDMIPLNYRQQKADYYDENSGSWGRVLHAWDNDDFVLDCTRITLYTGNIGVDGDTFKNEYLMERYGIQINKTSRNSVLFMMNIGTTRSSVAYLLEVLHQIATDFERLNQNASRVEQRVFEKKVYNLTENLPPLPDFSYFHAAFRADQSGNTPEGKIRQAFFLAYDDDCCEYIPLATDDIEQAIASQRELVSASFVTPYPPGFPILVPGQVISQDIVTFLRMLDVKEIHGFRSELGLRVFTQAAIEHQLNHLT